ncbi:MAG: hypothetical protein NTU61_01545 [Candidatus Altiarchaeota archaeon]|nr:hypothetical protein [Candidatus Altiarchaeota archaeon]
MPKMLLPTLRERNRYMTFEVVSGDKFERKEVAAAVWNSLTRLHGELGASKTSLWLMDWDKDKASGILKVNHKSVDTLRSSLALIKDVEKKQAVFHVKRTSGTLKKAREFT